MTAEQELDRLASRVSELASSLFAMAAAGAEPEQRRQELQELRKTLEALEVQAQLVALQLEAL